MLALNDAPAAKRPNLPMCHLCGAPTARSCHTHAPARRDARRRPRRAACSAPPALCRSLRATSSSTLSQYAGGAGRQFGSSSLEIHMVTCRKKYEREHGKPPPEMKAKIPTDQPIGSKSWAEFNDAQNEGWKEALEPCPNCGRTFLPDRLVVHLRSCGNNSSKRDGGRPGMSPPASSSRPTTPTSSKQPPVLPMCHLCGRQFGTSSLEIHMKECKKRYERERGKPAPDLPALKDGQALTPSQMLDLQAEGFKSSLEPCPHCGRTFLPDRLQVHLRSCSKATASPVKSPAPVSSATKPSMGTRSGQGTNSNEMSGPLRLGGTLAGGRPDSRGNLGQADHTLSRTLPAVKDSSGGSPAATQVSPSCSVLKLAKGPARPKPGPLKIDLAQAESSSDGPGSGSSQRAGSPRTPPLLTAPALHSAPSRLGKSPSATSPQLVSPPQVPNSMMSSGASPNGGGGSERKLNGGTLSSAEGGTTKGERSARDRMVELTELLESQLISKDEFELKRKAILDGI